MMKMTKREKKSGSDKDKRKIESEPNVTPRKKSAEVEKIKINRTVSVNKKKRSFSNLEHSPMKFALSVDEDKLERDRHENEDQS